MLTDADMSTTRCVGVRRLPTLSSQVWPVHIPELFSGQSRHSLSMIIYDPVSGAAMACADLEDDRLMDGLMYYINSDVVPFVPVVTESHLTRTERGTTELYMAMLNLPSASWRPGKQYRGGGQGVSLGS